MMFSFLFFFVLVIKLEEIEGDVRFYELAVIWHNFCSFYFMVALILAYKGYGMKFRTVTSVHS